MQGTPRRAILLLFALMLGGCELLMPPEPPPESVLNQGMVQALLDTGFYAGVSMTRVIGRHYDPSSRSWQVFACFQFAVAGGRGEGATCLDSFRAQLLDNGTWVVSTTVEGVYRWRAIGTGGESVGVPVAASGSLPAADSGPEVEPSEDG